MITISCSCGQSFDIQPSAIKKPQACPSCGQLTTCLCAENLPADGGTGDFDAVLVKKAGPKVPNAPEVAGYALGGCENLAIGRLPENNLSLPSNKVSRKHATLVRVDFGPSRWRIVDNQSSGGVYVNGQKVQEHDLSPGDEIVIGDYKFEYVVAGASGGLDESVLPQQEYVQPQQAPVYYTPQAKSSGGSVFTNWKIMAPVAAGVLLAAGGLIYALSGSGSDSTSKPAPQKPAGRPNFTIPQAVDNPLPTSGDNSQEAGEARRNSVLSAFNLRKIGGYINQYQEKNRKYPASLGDVATLDGVELDAFVKVGEPAPSDDVKADPRQLVKWINENTCYTFTGAAKPGGIIAYEKSAMYLADKTNALIFDGTVHDLSPEKLKEMLAEAPAVAAGAATNPPIPTPVAATPKPAAQTPVKFLTQAEFAALPKVEMPARQPYSLAEARKSYTTKLTNKYADEDAPPKPPETVFSLVQYDAPLGKMNAYLTPDPKNNKKNPAIIWLHGGETNGLGDVWTAQPATNDQSAAAYRKAGIVMMFPSMRGGSGNPGTQEAYYGEVDDVIAAADFLAKQPYVDPDRIYLGGHSNGGTLALLVAECTNRFRAVFSFGPIDDLEYIDPPTGDDEWPFDEKNKRETDPRTPALWLSSIQTPTFIFEGDQRPFNAVTDFTSRNSNPRVQTYSVRGKTHFTALAPMNTLIASKINQDNNAQFNIAFKNNEITGLTKEESTRPKPSTAPIQMTRLADFEPDNANRFNIDAVMWHVGYKNQRYKTNTQVLLGHKDVELRGAIGIIFAESGFNIGIARENMTLPDEINFDLSQNDLKYANNITPGQEIIVRGTLVPEMPSIISKLDKPQILALGPDPAIPSTVEGLYKEFSDDAAAAKKKYTGKYILLQGTLANGSTAKSFYVADPTGKAIEVFLSPTDFNQRKRNAGEKASVKGLVSFLNGKITLNRGWFLIDPQK